MPLIRCTKKEPISPGGVHGLAGSVSAGLLRALKRESPGVTINGEGSQPQTAAFKETPVVFCYKVTDGKWMPESLQYASMTRIDDRIMMFGGVRDEPHNDLYELNPVDWTWTRVKCNAGLFDVNPNPRYA